MSSQYRVQNLTEIPTLLGRIWRVSPSTGGCWFLHLSKVTVPPQNWPCTFSWRALLVECIGWRIVSCVCMCMAHDNRVGLFFDNLSLASSCKLSLLIIRFSLCFDIFARNVPCFSDASNMCISMRRHEERVEMFFGLNFPAGFPQKPRKEPSVYFPFVEFLLPYLQVTTLKTNISPEKWCVEDEICFWNGPFSGDMFLLQWAFSLAKVCKGSTWSDQRDDLFLTSRDLCWPRNRDYCWKQHPHSFQKSTCPSKNFGASTCRCCIYRKDSESIRGNVRRWWSSWRLSGHFAAVMTRHLSQNSVPHHEGLGKEPKESDASYFWPASFWRAGWRMLKGLGCCLEFEWNRNPASQYIHGGLSGCLAKFL